MTKRRKIIPYKPYLKEYARKLRNNSTFSEIILWKHLKGKQMRGYDFHRQKPLLDYIVDFFCHELLLGIELDGMSHSREDVFVKDEIKEKELSRYSITILRFDDEEVYNEIGNVLNTIEQYIDEFQNGNRKTHP